MVGAASPVWEVALSSATGRHLLETGRRHGLDPATCLAGTGLTSDDLADPATEVYASQELTMIRNVIGRLGDKPGLGMETGMQYNLADTGIFGYALMASPTFGDAIDVACRYAALADTYLSLVAEVTSSEAVIEFRDNTIPHDVRRFVMERDFAIMLRLLPLLLGANHPSVTLRMELADMQLPMETVELDGVAVHVEHTTRNALIIPADLIGRPMPAADPQTAAICIRQCEELLNRRRTRRGFSATVRTRLIQDSAEIPSMATVAKELCITERTLHRRLAAEGTSYRALLDEVRATLAGELLKSGLTVEETAQRLGYSETAAFTRAHIRWNGHPPSRRR
ncbi:AraC family transcriptional regulator [Mycobacterium sp. TY815]|uniref:AraC family transcriptional regulator n=1 Tax=Mycobacterium sp. TY815 TaxID=3050581 RepID=UPI0027416F0A|nr:AraC family transcriptional regulator [Mycobacterium sp. TY815]MDP7706213.1 AraC family transcriptional regulator ligand-binding domain-containing protein [Mycobacterium sp. TY815]